jgi:cytochrome c oxidase subunit 4
MSHNHSNLDAATQPETPELTEVHGNAGRKYVFTLIALLILTGITVLVAQFDLGEANVAAAVLIATVKASIVALIFMHLLHDKPMNAVILCTAFTMLGLLFLFSFMDSSTRIRPIPLNGQPPAGSDFNRAPTQTEPYLKVPPKTKPAPIETPR